MGIFNKKNSLDHTPGKVWATDQPVPMVQADIDYNSVLDWLCGLSDEDYAKTCEVAAIYRKANSDAAKALGVEHEAYTFINPPEPEVDEDQEIENILEEDDLESAFLDDDELTPKDKKAPTIKNSNK